MQSTEQSLGTLIAKLRGLAPLDDEDVRAVASLPTRTTRAASREVLVRDGDVPTECSLLVDGYAARSKTAADGGRQIVSFHIPGDVLDLQHLFLPRADHDVQTITAATVVRIPMADLRKLLLNRPAVGTAFWRDALIDASIFREWVLNVGRRDARTRIAHMLCEFIARCEAAGIGTAQRIRLPFSQDEIADATGLTPIHVNRMLRELDEDGLIRRTGRELTIEDWDGFQRLAGFDRAYLHAAA